MNEPTNRPILKPRPDVSMPGIFTRSMIMAIPLLALAIGILYWIFTQQVETQVHSLIEQEQAGIDVVERVIKRDFRSAIDDLIQVSENSNSIDSIRDKEPKAIAAMQSYFTSIISLREIYDQARLIDLDGQEIVRVNRAGRTAAVVTDNRLQNKKNRPYFQGTIRLKKGEVYISALDLNVEEGEVERPFKPAIRIATPVYNQAGEPTGIVVLNYLGQNILEELKQASHTRKGTYLLLNSEGYYLKGFEDKEEWGFQFRERSQFTFQNRYGNVWQAITRDHSGNIHNDDGLFIFHTIHPQKEARYTLSGMGTVNNYNIIDECLEDWVLVSFVPATLLDEFIHAGLQNLSTYMVLLGCAIAVVLLAGAFRLSYLRVHQLKAFSIARQMSAFPVYNPGPTVRLEPDGKVALANPVARSIFDIDPTGRAWSDLQSRYFSGNTTPQPDEKGVWQEEWDIGERTFLFAYKSDQETGDTYIYGIDYTERKANYKQLQENEQRILADTDRRRQAEALYRNLVQAIPDLVWLKDTDGVYLSCNTAFERFFGATQKQIVGKTDYDFVDKALADFFRNHDSIAIQSNGPTTNEEELVFAGDGYKGRFETIKAPLKNLQGQVIGVLGIARDITERKRMELDLRKLSRAIENSPTSIVITDIDGTIEFVNPKFCQVTGYSPDEVLGQNPNTLKSGLQTSDFYRQMWNQLTAGKEWRGEFHNKKKNGDLYWEFASIAPVKNDEGGIESYVAVKEDITERKESEKLVMRLGRILDSSLNEIYVVETTTMHFTQVSRGALENLGYTLEQMLTLTPMDIVPSYRSTEAMETLRPLIAGEKHFVHFNAFHERKDGTEYPVSINLQYSDVENPPVIIAIVQDISESVKAENRLKESEERYRQAQRASGIGSWVYDIKSRTTTWTPEVYCIFGVPPETFEVNFESFLTLLHPDDKTVLQSSVNQTIRSGAEYSLEFRINRPDGQVRWVHGAGGFVLDENGEPRKLVGVVMDITEKKQFEEQLKFNEKRFRGIVENVNDIIYMLSKDGFFVYVSPNWKTLLGHHPEDLLGRHLAEFVHPEDQNICQAFLDKIFKDGTSHTLVSFRVRHIGGQWRWYENNGVAFDDVEGKAAYLGTARDITDKKRAERELLEAEEKSRLLLESVGEGVYGMDLDGRTTFINPAAQKMLGYTEDEVVGRVMHGLVHHSYRDGSTYPIEKCPMYAAFSDGTVHHADDEILWRKDGSFFEVEHVSTPVKRDGLLIGAVVTFKDVSARKRADEALRASQEWFATTLNSIGDAVIATDVHQRVTYMNQIARDMTGSNIQDTGRVKIEDVMDLADDSDHSVVISPVIAALEKREVVDLQDNTLLVRKDGLEIPIDDSAAPIISEEGELLGAVMVFRNITHRKEAEAELIKAKDAAESGSRAKSSFLANMSHELRTPLNAVIGFSQVLQEDYFGPLTEKQAEYVANILASGQHLLTLINDILDLSKIEAGATDLDLTRINACTTIESSLTIITHKASKHNIHLQFFAEPELKDLTIEADETKFKQILYNLLSNAAKFTPDNGSITVSLVEKDGSIQISVADTGIGIEPEYQEKIFEPFYQVKGEYQKKVAGTGLGMSLCRQLVELHGGEIWLESEGKDKGTTILFSLPISQGLTGTDPPPAIASDESGMGLPVDRKNLGEFVELITAKARRHQHPLALFILGTIPPLDARQAMILTESLKESKRDHDLIKVDENGLVYFILIDIEPEYVGAVQTRFRSKVESAIEENQRICAFVSLDVTPETMPADLLQALLKELETVETDCLE